MTLRIRASLAVVFSGLVGTSAYAAVPTEVATAATDLTTSIGEYAATFLPLAAAVAVAFIGMKWLKKFVNKAS